MGGEWTISIQIASRVSGGRLGADQCLGDRGVGYRRRERYSQSNQVTANAM